MRSNEAPTRTNWRTVLGPLLVLVGASSPRSRRLVRPPYPGRIRPLFGPKTDAYGPKKQYMTRM